MIGNGSGYAIVGLGVTKMGRLPGLSSIDLRIEALQSALVDAGITAQDVSGFVYQPGSVEVRDYCFAGEVPKLMGFPINFVWNVQSGGTSAMLAILSACGAIEAGICDYVAVSYGDTMLSSSFFSGESRPQPAVSYDNMGVYGMSSLGGDHALAAQRHMHEFGTTKEQLGAIALNGRNYANLREDAFLHDRPLSMEEYLGAKPLADPLNKFDHCLVTDGACAFIVARADRAKDAASIPVHIGGMGFGHSISEAFHGRSFRQAAIKGAGETALRKAGIDLQDIDVAQIYDCFTITVLMALEGFGFCGLGEGGQFVEEGNLGLDGALPTNTAGGQLAWGYMQGFTPIVEAVRQLRGEAGPTQVSDARHCLVSGHGATYKTVGSMEYADGAMILRRG